MKLLMRLTLLIILITGVLASCKKKVPKQTRHIPREATIVAAINTKSLQKKLIKSQVTIENLLKNLTSDHDSAFDKGKKEWEDLRNSGIDLDEDMYFAFEQKGGGMATGQASGVFSVIASVDDASKIEAYVKKKRPTAPVQKEKDFSYAVEGNNMIAWNKEVIIGMSYQKSYTGGMEYDSTTQTYKFNKPNDVNAINDLKTEMTAYMNRKEETSVTALPEFRDLMQEKSDASVWVNSAGSVADMPLPLPKLKELFENSYTAATINFEDGKIVGSSKSYTSKPLSDIMEKYSGSTVNLSLVETYPSSNIDGFMVLAFNPEIITGIVNYLEVGGMADSYLTQFMGSNYTLKEFLKIFKGDFAFIASDFNPNSGEQSMLPIKGLFNATVADKAQLTKVLDKLAAQQLVVKRGNEYVLNPAMSKTGFYVSIDDKNILAGNDSLLIAQYRAGTGKAVVNKEVMDDFKDKTSAVYVDATKIMSAIPAGSQDLDSVLLSAKQTFKDMKAYGTKFNGKFTEGHYEFRMVNEKENSLTSLIQFMAVAGETVKKRQAAMPRDIMIDSTAPNAIDTVTN